MTILFALVRAVHFAGVMIAFGGSAYLALIGRAAEARPRDSRLRLLFGVAATAALFTAVVMLCLTAGAMSGDWRAAYGGRKILAVAMDTSYGHVFLFRVPVLVGLLLSCVFARRPLAPLNAALAGLALAAIALTSHAAATGSALLATNDALHLLCAGFWIGGLSVLALIVVERRPGLPGALRLFSLSGTYAVLLLTVAGTVNALAILHGPFASWSSTYLTVLTIKIMLAALMIALALANRFRLTPAIHAGESDATEMLRWSVAAELAIGAIVVFLAALLGSLPYSTPA